MSEENLLLIPIDLAFENVPFGNELISWCKIANELNNATMELTNLVFKKYNNPSSFRFDGKYIKRLILESFGVETLAIYNDSQLYCKHPELRNTREIQNLWKQRETINRNILKLYNRLGYECYAHHWDESKIPDDKKSPRSEKKI